MSGACTVVTGASGGIGEVVARRRNKAEGFVPPFGRHAPGRRGYIAYGAEGDGAGAIFPLHTGRRVW